MIEGARGILLRHEGKGALTLRWRMLGRRGWAVDSTVGKGSPRRDNRSLGNSGRPRDWRGLKGRSWGWCPVPGRECACAGRGAAIGRNRRERPTRSSTGRTQPRSAKHPSLIGRRCPVVAFAARPAGPLRPWLSDAARSLRSVAWRGSKSSSQGRTAGGRGDVQPRWARRGRPGCA